MTQRMPDHENSQASKEHQDVFSRLLQDLRRPIHDDPIVNCGGRAVANITADPDAALKLADQQLHIFPFKDVEPCWRRLYTDSGISRALKLLTSKDRPNNWLDKVIRQLDMVLIMTGAPLRENMIEQIFTELQRHYTSKPDRWSDFLQNDTRRVPKLLKPLAASSMTLSQFKNLLQLSQPHVIKDSIEHWPALSTRPWSSRDYLRYQTFDGRRLVPIELGRSYTDENWGQTIMPFSELLDRYVCDQGETLAYLAQHDLFAQIPALRNDIAIPDFCYIALPPLDPSSPLQNRPSNSLKEPLLNAWFGPAGTISPLHTDPYHNILCQVVGKKYIRLYSPKETPRLYPRGTEDGIDMSNTSSIPTDNVEMDLEVNDDFPLFHDAPYVETVLQEGDCLYIPAGWWHYVRSLSISFSVSFWWN